MKHPQSQADHLQILASRCGRDVPWFSSDIVDDTLLQPRYQEVCAFVNYSVFDTRETIENNCSRATLDVVERCLDEGGTDGEGDGVSIDGSQSIGHYKEARALGILSP